LNVENEQPGPSFLAIQERENKIFASFQLMCSALRVRATMTALQQHSKPDDFAELPEVEDVTFHDLPSDPSEVILLNSGMAIDAVAQYERFDRLGQQMARRYKYRNAVSTERLATDSASEDDWEKCKKYVLNICKSGPGIRLHEGKIFVETLDAAHELLNLARGWKPQALGSWSM
jgi:hypothetical protein